MRGRGRSTFEGFVVVVVVMLTVLLATGLFKGRVRAKSGEVLTNELSMMRSAITLYKTLNRVYPPHLEALHEQTYDFGDGEKRPYLDRLPEKSDGKILDPFGNPYVYTPKDGWVHSTTDGYQNW